MQVLKHYMKTDTADYSDLATLSRATSRKRARRTDSMDHAALAGAGDDVNAAEHRATDADMPFEPEDASPGEKGIPCVL